MPWIRRLFVCLALVVVVGGSAQVTANAQTTTAPQRLVACGEAHLPPCW